MNSRSIWIILAFLFLTWNGFGQSDTITGDRVAIQHADYLENTIVDSVELRKLVGNVRLGQRNMIMTCDSAVLDIKANRVVAYGRVHINQSDSIHAYGDKLVYDGKKEIAILYNNVLLTDRTMRLTTDYLNYNMKNKRAYYSGGGTVRNKNMNLSSGTGIYYTRSKNTFFRSNVKVRGNDYRISTDTMRYNIARDKSTFLAPTYINKSGNEIYCERGYYDNVAGIGVFHRNAIVKNKEQELFADSIYYNENTGIGKAYRNVKLIDKAQDLITYSSYAEYDENTGRMVAKTDALFVTVMENDSLYLGADNLASVQKDTTGARMMTAEGRVKVYKSDLQGACDSLIFDEGDSLLMMFGNPVLWSDSSQFLADTIIIYLRNQQVDQIKLYTNAMIINASSGEAYNQISGRFINGVFNEKKLAVLFVDGNGETIYYALDDEDAFLGVNRALCSNMAIYVENDKIDRIIFYEAPEATFTPIQKANLEEMKLENFEWRERERPRSKEDLKNR